MRDCEEKINAARVISRVRIDVIVGNKSGKEKHGHNDVVYVYLFMREKQDGVYSIR